MFRGLSPWLQWLPGRLMHVNVVGCGIFAAVSGSSAATCATIGKIALPELEKRGYDKTSSLGSLAGSGTLGLLIPPSIPMVVYAVTANVSVLQVFLGGFLPGLLVMALYSGYIILWSLSNPEQDAAARSADAVPAKAAGIGQADPLPAAHPGGVPRRSCSALRPRPNAPPGASPARSLLAWWSGTLTRETFFESVMSATRLTCMIMLILAGAALPPRRWPIPAFRPRSPSG